MNKPHRHRVGRGNPSIRLDPYAIEETTFTLAEWRRCGGQPPPPPVPTKPTERQAA